MGILSPPPLSFRARGGGSTRRPERQRRGGGVARNLSIPPISTSLPLVPVSWPFAGLPRLQVCPRWQGLLSLQVSPFRLSFRAPRTGPQTALNASKGPVGWRGSPRPANQHPVSLRRFSSPFQGLQACGLHGFGGPPVSAATRPARSR